jgi:hypothetical protein
MVGCVCLPVEALAEVPVKHIGVAGTQRLGQIQDRAVENGCFSAQDLAQLHPELWGQPQPAGGGDDQGLRLYRPSSVQPA